jgi:putative ubiquitin-RnfH superfamily antitoxin RatB of RatAB toxin-antitoxin module
MSIHVNESVATGTITVEVVWCPSPRNIKSQTLDLAKACTAQQAVAIAAPALGLGPDDLKGLSLAIWNIKSSGQTQLQSTDRVEVLRPLTVDPKVARQLRFDKQGKRGAGLFRIKKPAA